MTTATDAPRIDSLTGLRFLAAGAVLLHHTLAPTILTGGVASIPGTRHFAVVGYGGVTAFFVLSGFVLAWSWDDRRTRAGFYGRRFARVWPLHALTFLVVVLAVEPIVGGVGNVDTTAPRALAGLALVHAWVPRPLWYFAGNGPSWSLACEAFFYALLPFLVPVLRRAGRRAAVSAVVVSAALLVVVPLLVRAAAWDRYALLSLTVFPGYRVAEFVVGVVLGWAVRSGWRPAWSLWQAVLASLLAYLAAALAVGGLYFTQSPRSDAALGNIYTDAILLLPVAGLIAALAARDLEGRPCWLARPLPVLLGGASFAFYLVHVPIIELFGELAPGTRQTARGLPVLAAVVVVALALALALHKLVERPVERALRRRIEAREAARSEALVRGVS
ncbi:MAG: hypothetical protein JWO22_3426 [Frankiales bacterium]|nr:hypothetical protein [Frankiales bacterium]